MNENKKKYENKMKLWRTLKAKKQKSKMGGHQQSKVVYATG